MQTFLPYPCFSDSAAAMDDKRLNKQIVEVQQIYKALTVPGYGWQHHPAVKMWRGEEYALLRYGFSCYLRWQRRNNGMTHKSGEYIAAAIVNYWDCGRTYPSWFGNAKFHASHRAALLYKNFAHYSQFGWAESPAIPDEKGRLPYVWPVK